MLNDLEITRLTENTDGSLSVSVKTNDSELGPHRFAMAIGAGTYAKLPNTKQAKEKVLKTLIKANIAKQHAYWVKRKTDNPDTDVSDIITNRKITV